MPNSPYNEFFICSWIYSLGVLLQFLFLCWDTLFAHSMIILPLCPCVCMLVAQSCLTICDPMACNPPDSSAHGILQAVILEWVVIPFSRVSSHPRHWTWAFCIAGRFFTIWAFKLFTLLFKVLLSSVNYQELWSSVDLFLVTFISWIGTFSCFFALLVIFYYVVDIVDNL